MNKAINLFDKLIDIYAVFSRENIMARDKVLFCIYRGQTTPREIMQRLNLAKGNLANYCKDLIAKKYLTKTKETGGREISYQITEAGTKYITQIITKTQKQFDNIEIK